MNIDRLQRAFQSDQDQAIARLAVRRGWITEEQASGKIDALLTREQIFELTEQHLKEELTRMALSRASSMPAEVQAALSDPAMNLSEFTLVSRLGRGGVGEVWKAWDRQLHRWVAIKRPLALPSSDDALERFRREVQATSRLAHPNIVPIYRVAEHDGRPYIVMQLVRGRPAHELRLPVRRALEVMRFVGLALHHAHENGVVHRDLKPANIMIDPDGSGVWVLDFGLANLVESRTMTATGTVMGTPSYMSPEQARGDAEARRPATDVYSLGATLYELLTGRPPFVGEQVAEIVHKILETEPPAPRFLNPDLPRDVETIVLKAMEKSIARRYSSALDFAEDLQRYLDGEPIRAKPASVGYRLKKRMAKHRGLVAVAAASALVLAGYGAYVAAERGQQRRAQPHFDVGLDRARTLDRLWSLPDPAPIDATFDEAVRNFQKAMEIDPIRGEAALQIARLYYERGNDAEALKYCDEAIRRSPDLATAYLQRALIRLEEFEERRHHRGQESGPLEERIQEDLRRVLQWNQEAPELQYARGMLEFAQGNYAEAGRILESYLARVPTDWRALAWCAHAYVHVPDPAKTVAYADRAIRLRPRSMPLYGFRGNARVQMKDWDGAIEDYTRALELRRDSPGVYSNRAWAWVQKKEFEKGIADMTRAIELAPKNASHYAHRGRFRAANKDPRGALEDFDQAARLDPQSVDALTGRGRARRALGGGALEDYLQAARILEARSDWRGAEKLYLEVLSEDRARVEPLLKIVQEKR
jgi:serine/threonine-protein kinase